MALHSVIATKKSARDRKNPRSAENYAKRRHDTNALRPKQTTIVDQLKDGTVVYIGPFRG